MFSIKFHSGRTVFQGVRLTVPSCSGSGQEGLRGIGLLTSESFNRQIWNRCRQLLISAPDFPSVCLLKVLNKFNYRNGAGRCQCFLSGKIRINEHVSTRKPKYFVPTT